MQLPIPTNIDNSFVNTSVLHLQVEGYELRLYQPFTCVELDFNATSKFSSPEFWKARNTANGKLNKVFEGMCMLQIYNIYNVIIVFVILYLQRNK